MDFKKMRGDMDRISGNMNIERIKWTKKFKM